MAWRRGRLLRIGRSASGANLAEDGELLPQVGGRESDLQPPIGPCRVRADQLEEICEVRRGLSILGSERNGRLEIVENRRSRRHGSGLLIGEEQARRDYEIASISAVGNGSGGILEEGPCLFALSGQCRVPLQESEELLSHC